MEKIEEDSLQEVPEEAVEGTKAEMKFDYDKRLCDLLEQYTQMLDCVTDNVGSKHLQGICTKLRPNPVVLMGKSAEKPGNSAYHSINKSIHILKNNIFATRSGSPVSTHHFQVSVKTLARKT